MRTLFVSICVFISLFADAQSAADILDRAIEYHDPSEEWNTLHITFKFTETRPDSPDRSTEIQLDNSTGYMKINRNNEEIFEVAGEEGKVLKGDKEEERAILLRNYYLYLWGLPMKLKDEGTPMDDVVTREKVDGVDCQILRVKYEKDTWYFYFHPETGRLIRYKFYQDEAETKGELIKLEDELEVGSMKIPKKRSWYTLPEMRYLGMDILSSVE